MKKVIIVIAMIALALFVPASVNAGHEAGTEDGRVPGQPFALLQQQIDQLWDAVNNNCNGQSTPLLPTAVAHAFPDRATVGSSVVFTARGSFHPDDVNGEPLTYDWDFGDGQGGSLFESPSYAYNTAGTYVAVLRVKSATGFVDADTVVVRVAEPLSLGIQAMPSSGMSPLIVNFQANVGGGFPPYSYLWDFGDGSTSPIPNPTHTYFAANVFTATLAVTDASGEAITLGVLVEVTPTMPPEPPMP